jgi:hypothetical protein
MGHPRLWITVWTETEQTGIANSEQLAQRRKYGSEASLKAWKVRGLHD